MLNHTQFRQQLSQLIATPSVSCTDSRLDMGNHAVAELLANWLQALGFKAELLPIPGHSNKVNMVATLGQGNGGLVLAGHTDTVPYDQDRWHQDPFTLTEKDSRFYGLGATDMKGFFPVVLAALERIIETGADALKHPVIVLATADEESTMSGARSLTQEHIGGAQFALVGEPTGLKPIRMHKGIMMEEVRIEGRSGHSSNPALGANALEAMSTALNQLLEYRHTMQQQWQHSGFAVKTPTLNLGCIHGGDNPNRICAACHLHYDVRTLPGQTIEQVRSDIAELLSPISQQFGVKLTTAPLFPGAPAFEQDANSALVKVVQELTHSEADSVAFATEAPYLQALGAETLVMGPGSIDLAHQPNEYLDHEYIEPAVDLIENIIWRMCG